MSVEQSRPVCIVEDDADVRASVRLLLEATGYRVVEFANAEAFLRATDGRDAACLVFDLYMGGMTGLDLLESLRSDGVQTPAIIMTANGNDLDARCTRAGALALLHKPSAASEMLAWVAHACGSH
ncbi:MAG TPA: response regulator [Rhizomicrobium sp.]|nr:response regulator [Rhizomicrobium sp.]